LHSPLFHSAVGCTPLSYPAMIRCAATERVSGDCRRRSIFSIDEIPSFLIMVFIQRPENRYRCASGKWFCIQWGNGIPTDHRGPRLPGTKGSSRPCVRQLPARPCNGFRNDDGPLTPYYCYLKLSGCLMQYADEYCSSCGCSCGLSLRPPLKQPGFAIGDQTGFLDERCSLAQREKKTKAVRIAELH